MSWFKALASKAKGKERAGHREDTNEALPEWQPAPEQVHAEGLYADATREDYEKAEAFCRNYPPVPPRLLSSEDIERIRRLGCGAWELEQPADPRFSGRIDSANGGEKGHTGVVKVKTEADCKDACLLSNLPILAGLYDTRGREGVYYEIKIIRMDSGGVIAVGTACRPYPEWRLPGWNRLSAGLHLDDCRKFFEDPDGGRDYFHGVESSFSAQDTIGVGYTWANGGLFFTHNGRRLPDAFSGVYLPRERHDVYAAIGVSGPGVCEFEVNFGAGTDFEWKEGNNWKVEGHVGMMPGGSGGADDELPSYSDARMDRRVIYQ